MSIQKLYDSVKPIVWAVFECSSEEDEMDLVSTAFAVKEGLLMTCAHGGLGNKRSDLTFKARQLSDNVLRKAFLVDSRTDCDISLFRVEGAKDMPVGKFGSGTLSIGETVMVLGNPLGFVGFGLIGKVSFPCVESPAFDESLICETYVSDALKSIPSHRVAGHLWNEKSIKKAGKDPDTKNNLEFTRNLKANLPVVQSSGLFCCPGCSGAPMFNMKGEIVGMHVIHYHGIDVAVHVSVLRKILDANTNDEVQVNAEIKLMKLV